MKSVLDLKRAEGKSWNYKKQTQQESVIEEAQSFCDDSEMRVLIEHRGVLTSLVSSGSEWSTVRDKSFCRYLSAFKGSVCAFSSNLQTKQEYWDIQLAHLVARGRQESNNQRNQWKTTTVI